MTFWKQKIVGLDIGSSSIKAVCLQKSLTGVEWAGGYRLDFPEPVPVLEWSKASFEGFKEWFSKNCLPSDRVVVSLPVHLLSLRTITLPFSDSRRVEKVVPFEVESLLPHPLEEVVVDYQIFQESEGQSHMIVAAVPRNLISDVLGKLLEMDIHPEMMDLDGMSLMNLGRFIQLPEGDSPKTDSKKDTLVLDIGAAKTVCCILREGKPTYIRTILWGGNDINRVIREHCGGSAEEAEEWKCQVGLRDDGISRLNEKGISKAVRSALEPFTAELLRMIHLYSVQQAIRSGNGDRSQGLVQFALFGGGKKLRGLEDYLTETLELSPARFNLPPGFEPDGGWDPQFAIGLGLALKGARQAGVSRMNFRKPEFGTARGADTAGNKGKVLWVLGLLFAGVAFVDLYVKHDLKVQRYNQVKTEVESQFRTIFPDIRTIVDEVQQAKNAVAELEKRSKFLGIGMLSPLELMAEMTRRMPQGIKVEVFDLIIEKGGLRFEAETDKFESLDKIKASLEEYDGFGEVKISDAKVSADLANVRFRMTINPPAEK